MTACIEIMARTNRAISRQSESRGLVGDSQGNAGELRAHVIDDVKIRLDESKRSMVLRIGLDTQ
jgi:hypothetical protein